MLIDPNDQANIGRILQIKDIDEQQYKELGGNYKLYSADDEIEPLRTYDRIR